MTVRVKLERGFARELFSTSVFRRILEHKLDAAARTAAATAPDDPRTPTDDLKSSISGEVDLAAGGYRGRLVAENFKAAWFEEGATGVPPRPYLRPAVEQHIGPIEPAVEGGSSDA